MKTILDEKRLLFLVTLLVLCCACTPRFTKPNTEEALMERVCSLWEARVKGERGTVYDMADSKFKKGVPRERFIKRANVVTKKFIVSKVEVNENAKEGSSMVIFETYKMGRLFKISIKEIWLFEAGAWHLKLSDRRTPFDHKERP